jgi:hypothetical protein
VCLIFIVFRKGLSGSSISFSIVSRKDASTDGTHGAAVGDGITERKSNADFNGEAGRTGNNDRTAIYCIWRLIQ